MEIISLLFFPSINDFLNIAWFAVLLPEIYIYFCFLVLFSAGTPHSYILITFTC